jgi:hypothetical protein
MLKIVSTIFALAVAVVAVRRVVQAKQGAQPVNLQAEAAAEKAKAKAKQTLENAKENVEGVAAMAKDKVRNKSDR